MAEQESLTGADSQPTGDVTHAAPGEDTGQGVQDPAPSTSNEQGNWVDTLPETIRDWDEVKNSDSPEKFFDQVANMRSMIGKSIRIPGEEAGEEARQEFIKKLQEVPGVMMSPSDENDVQGFLESLNGDLQQAAYNKLKEQYTEHENSQILEELEQERQAGFDALRKEWGNGYDRKVQQAKMVVRSLNDKLGDDRLVKVLDKTGAAMNPEMIAVFAQIGDMIGEKPALEGEGSNQFGMTPADAKQAIADIKQNPLYWNGSKDPIAHDQLVKKANELYEIAYPGEQVLLGEVVTG